MRFRVTATIAPLILIVMSVTFPSVACAQLHPETVKVNGSPRTMFVHLPPNYTSKKRYPVVLVLHGIGGDGSVVARITHFDRVADQYNFIVVYPNARDGRWTVPENDAVRSLGGFGRPRGRLSTGEPRGGTEVGGQPVNDMMFFNELLDQVEAEYSVDASRIYATGISDGGIMDFRLGCELAGRIAAIAPVAATFPQGLSDTCADWFWRAVPLLMINGTADPVVPYNGRLSYNAGHFLLSAKDSAKAWAKMDGCGAKPGQSNLELREGGGLETRVETYGDCKDGSAVLLYSVMKGGHTWPGGAQYMPENAIGKTTNGFDASEAIWKFFAEHPMAAKKP